MKNIPLTKGKFAIVDNEDYEFLMQWKWHFASVGYAARRKSMKKEGSDKMLYMHTAIAEYKETDHANRNGLDNRRSNLRSCTRSQNTANTMRKHNESGYRGVKLEKKCHSPRWSAHIKKDGKRRYLGIFTSKEDAALAYNKMAKELFGEFAFLNKLPLRT